MIALRRHTFFTFHAGESETGQGTKNMHLATGGQCSLTQTMSSGISVHRGTWSSRTSLHRTALLSVHALPTLDWAHEARAGI